MISRWHPSLLGKVIFFTGSLVLCATVVMLFQMHSVEGMDLPSEVLDLVMEEWKVLRGEMRAESSALDPGRFKAVQAWEEFNGHYFVMFSSTNGSGNSVVQIEDAHLKTLSFAGGTGTPQPGFGTDNLQPYSLQCVWIYGLPTATHIVEVVVGDGVIQQEVDGRRNMIIAWEKADGAWSLPVVRKIDQSGELIGVWR